MASKANVTYVVFSTFLLPIVLEAKTALTSGDRYTSGFSHGEQQAAIDFQNNSTFNPVCVNHTSYYYAGYSKGYNVTWNNLAAKGPTSYPNPNPPAFNYNTTVPNPPFIIPPSTDSWVGPFIIFVIVVLIIVAIARKLKRKSGKYKERKDFSDSVKEKRLERQHHRCANCNRVLNVVDWHHNNGNRSDNRESNCVALCPNCHAVRTRRHQ